MKLHEKAKKRGEPNKYAGQLNKNIKITTWTANEEELELQREREQMR